MSLTRWQPLNEAVTLRDTLNTLFDTSLFQPMWSASGLGMLPLDIIERDSELLVRAAAPGFAPEEVEISVQGDLLTLKGAMQETHQDEQEHYHLREYRAQRFQRTVRLPRRVNADEVQAEYKNGMLTIHLPIAEEERARRIPVQQG